MTNPKHTSSDLVERLRDRKIIADTNPWLRADAICVEAADRIEALEAENERLREEVQSLTDELGYQGIYPRPLLDEDQ